MVYEERFENDVSVWVLFRAFVWSSAVFDLPVVGFTILWKTTQKYFLFPAHVAMYSGNRQNRGKLIYINSNSHVFIKDHNSNSIHVLTKRTNSNKFVINFNL